MLTVKDKEGQGLCHFKLIKIIKTSVCIDSILKTISGHWLHGLGLRDKYKHTKERYRETGKNILDWRQSRVVSHSLNIA